MRTDKNLNPTAFTTDVAKTANLIEGTDFVEGDPFTVETPSGPRTYFTARLVGDPVALTLKVIDYIGFYTMQGVERWTYIAMPQWLWQQQTRATKVRIIGFMYKREGGTAMQGLFPPA